MTRHALDLETDQHIGCWTKDHWTGTSQYTFAVSTYGYIENWKLLKAMIGFKIRNGSKTGDMIFADHLHVVSKYDDKPIFSLMRITDITGSMVTHTEYLRQDEREKGYCMDQVFCLNTTREFKDKKVGRE